MQPKPSSQPKQNPTQSEALLLIRMKRSRAKGALCEIVKPFCVIGYVPVPGLELLLDYLSNMVYALELLLKVMADDWREPGKSRFNHRVGEMYEEVFGRPHASPILMTVLERAIRDQKFLYEPSDRLMDHIPEIEGLWDELTTEFYGRNWQGDATVLREVVAPPEFIQFLRDHLPRYLLPEPSPVKPRMSREQHIQMLQYKIQFLQSELERVQVGEEPPEETLQQMCERLDKERSKLLEGAESCFDYHLKFQQRPFTFGTWIYGKVLDGWLDDRM
jgi:hypothetical protein